MFHNKKKVLVFIILSCSIFVSSLLSSQMVYSAPGVFNLQIKELADVQGKYSYYVTVPSFPDRNSDYICTIDRELPRGVTVKVYENSDREYKYPLYLERRGGKIFFTAKGDEQLRVRFELERYSYPVKGFSLDLLYDEIKSRKRDWEEAYPAHEDRVYSRKDAERHYPEAKKVRRMPASSSSLATTRRGERGDSRDRDDSSYFVKELERAKQEISRLSDGTISTDIRTSQGQCRQIGNSRSLSDFLGNLHSFNNQRCKLNGFVVNACLKALRNINGSIELIDTLLQVAESKGAVDAVTINTAIQAFVAGGNYPKAKELYNSYSSLRDDKSVNIMLKVAGENNDVDFMLQLFDDNLKLKDVVTLNTLIQQLANNKCYPKAKELYNNYSSLRNERTVAIMLTAAGENNDVDFMLKLFDDNPRLENAVALTTLIQQLANNKCYSKAKELYNSHSSSGNGRTVNVMLKAAGENNDVDFAEQLFDDNPTLRDVVTLNTLIQQLTNNKSYPKAKQLYNSYSGSRDKMTIAIMLTAAGENNDVDFMLQLFDDNPKLRDVVTLTTLIQQLANNKCYPKAKKLYNSHLRLRDDTTVNIMLTAAGENNDVDFMLQLFDDNPKLRDVITLTTLIQQLASNNRYPKAKELYNSYSGLKNDMTVNVMIAAAGENNDVDFMLQFLKDNPKLSNVVTVTTLIQSLAKNKRYLEAKELYNNHSGLRDDRAVNVMLKAAGENNDVGFAEQLFNECKSRTRDDEEQTIMFNIYSDIIGIDKARPLFNEFLGCFEKVFSPVSGAKIDLHEFSKVSAELFLANQIDELFKSNDIIEVVVGKGLHTKSKKEDEEHKVLEGFNSFLERHSEIKAKQDPHNVGRYYLERDASLEVEAAL